jgi:hypothetical protein
MSPEGVKPEWVEKAAREVYAEWENEYTGDVEWPAWDSDENLARDTARTWARNILAAVLPEIQAQAFDDFAARVRAQWAKDGERCPWVGALDDEAARLREGAKGDDEG